MNYVEELYFRWLCSIIFPDLQTQYLYSNLLEFLYGYYFKYDIHKYPLDQNREINALDLRKMFSYRLKIPEDIIKSSIIRPCTILELIADLAIRIENDIMADPSKGDRTDYWAKMMLYNLHILEYTNSVFDAEVAKQKIDCFLDRNYAYNGDGGLFKMNNPRQDMTKIDIWKQACYYITEISQREGD